MTTTTERRPTMPEPWHTIAVALAATLVITAVIFRLLLKWISSRTATALVLGAVVLNLSRAVARHDWKWTALDAGAALVLAWLWWGDRRRCGTEQP
jgi:hypothetical protein